MPIRPREQCVRAKFVPGSGGGGRRDRREGLDRGVRTGTSLTLSRGTSLTVWVYVKAWVESSREVVARYRVLRGEERRIALQRSDHRGHRSPALRRRETR